MSEWCEACEGDHASHPEWLAEQAAAAAAWSASAESLEEALRAYWRAMDRASPGPGEDAEARRLYQDARPLAMGLRRVADATAWRAAQEAALAENAS